MTRGLRTKVLRHQIFNLLVIAKMTKFPEYRNHSWLIPEPNLLSLTTHLQLIPGSRIPRAEIPIAFSHSRRPRHLERQLLLRYWKQEYRE